MSAIPGMRSARACMQFITSGCPNCEEIVQLRNSPEAVAECTSQLFEGLITLNDPKSSWVAKWLRLSDYEPGIYAAKVQGLLPEDVVAALEDAGVTYVPRDGGEVEAGSREERD